MTDTSNNNYAKYSKLVWMIYSIIVVILIVILVLFVAQDNEERLFYSLMTAAASYVFRPSDKTIGKYTLKFFGVSSPEE